MSRYYLQNQPKHNLSTSVIFFVVLIRKYIWGLSCQSSGLRLHASNAGTWVRSLLRELKPPCLMAWPKNIFFNQINKIEKKEGIIKKKKVYDILCIIKYMLQGLSHSDPNYCPASHHSLSSLPRHSQTRPCNLCLLCTRDSQTSTSFFLFLAPTRKHGVS